MKSIKVYKLGVALVFACLIITSCPSPFSAGYYIQQQNRAANNGNNNNDNPPDLNDDTSPMPPLPDGKLNAFWVILRDGFITEPDGNNAAHTQFAEKLNNGHEFPTAQFDDWKFKSNFSSSNVPEMEYAGTVTWNGEQYKGEDAHAGGNKINSMVYYRYRGKNPFGLYKNEKYPVYNTEGKPPGKKEALMTRFVFYRFTGKGGGVADLDNYIVAVLVIDQFFLAGRIIKCISVVHNSFMHSVLLVISILETSIQGERIWNFAGKDLILVNAVDSALSVIIDRVHMRHLSLGIIIDGSLDCSVRHRRSGSRLWNLIFRHLERNTWVTGPAPLSPVRGQRA